ncbi:MAG: hypothetical protein NTY20_04120, partial [Candidatus Aenigmarchaeota archaeon]|nr:hypothetical protein [Candidatus Aenigmarchaeota archaeon]
MGPVTYPTGNRSFQFASSVPLWANAWDDCDTYVPGVTVRLRAVTGANQYVPTPEPANSLGNGSYNATWNSGESSLGKHNATVNATKNLYQEGYDIETDAFTLAQAPILQNPWVDKPNEGWGYNFTFKVSFQDLDDDDIANVSFWISNSTSGPWTLVDYQNGTGGAGEYNLTFRKSFTCNQYKIGPTLYFKFNATDIYNLTAGSSTASTSLERDNVSILTIAGNNSVIDREGADTENLIVLINDTDAGLPAGANVNGTFWIQYNYINFDSGHNVTTNSSGYTNYTFPPDCTYKNGSQYWYAEVRYDSCYDDEAMTSWETLSILGQLKLGIDRPLQGSNFNVTDNVFMNFTVYTDCSSEGNISGVTNTIYFFNTTSVGCSECPYDQGGGVYNCTLNTTGLPEGNWSINITADLNTFNPNNTVWWNRFWLENKNPTASGQTTSPSSAGWGARYTYNITINDPENDTTMCTLYTNTTGSGWVQRGYSILSNGQGNCTVSVQDFVSNDMGATQYRFRINDTFNWFETANFTGPTLGKDNVTITFVYGNYTGGQEGLVNRSGNQNTTMIIFVNDTERGSPPSGINVTFYVMTGGTTWDSGNVTLTNGTGYSSYYFNPNCNYQVGSRFWFAGVRDTRYQDRNTSENYTVLIRGDLVSRIQLPNGTEHLRGTNVTIRANVTDEDECSNMLNQTTVTFQMTNVNGSTYSCTGINDEGNGWYNCSFNTTGMPPRMYNITMNSSKQYYNNLTITMQYVQGQTSFWVETSPILWQSTVTINPMVGGWSEPFTFNVTVMDDDLDTIKVDAYFRQETPTQGAWQALGSVQNSGINWTANFSKDSFGPGYVDKILSVMFNATEYNDDQWYFNTTPVNFTVERNDVNFTYTSGNETNVNRVGTNNVTFIVYVYDQDNPAHPAVTGTNGPGMFWITTNASNPGSLDSGTSRDTNASGYMSYDFNPEGCVYGTGKQKWKAGIIEGSTYYKPKNYTTEFNVTITSEFTPSMIYPKNQSFIKGVDQFNLSANLSDVDGCGLVGDGNVTFRILGTSYTYQSTGNGAGIYNATITDTNLPEYTYGWYNLTVNASRQYYPNASSVQNYSFYLASKPVLSITGGGVNPMTGGWGKTFNFTVKVYDQDGNNVTVHLWKKPTSVSNWEHLESQTCYPCSTQPANPSTLVFTINNFTCGDVNNSEYKFNGTDEFGYTSTSEPGGSFVIEKDTVSYTVIAGAGENAIREGDNITLLSVLVQDSDRGYASLGLGYNGSFYVTTDNAAWSPSYNTTTNSSGYINLNFNATCSHLYGPQKWKAGIEGDSCYNQFNIFTGNQTLYVIGRLKNNILTPSFQQIFNVTENITIRLNTTSDCSGEGLINNSYVTVQLKSPSSAWESCSPVNNESSPQGIYNCT